VNPAATSFSDVARPSSPPAPATIATRALLALMPPPPWNGAEKRMSWRFSFRSWTDLVGQDVFRFAAGKVKGGHRIPVI
jgi:hypothetical protein